jgi:hypothetical protein
MPTTSEKGRVMVKLYREWAQKVTSRRGLMIEADLFADICKVQYDPGYSSIYMFDEPAAKEIKASGKSAGLDKYPVYSNCVTIDIDAPNLVAAEAELGEVERKLQERGLAHDVWFSGGKGFHVTIPHEMMSSKHLPHSQRKFVEDELKVQCDITLYQHGRLLSLPNRVHPKTRKRKHKIKSVAGDQAQIKLVEKPELVFDFSGDSLGDLQMGLTNLSTIASKDIYPGGRHQAIWSTAKDLARAGVSVETTIELMLAVNGLWSNKKSAEEVRLAVTQAYAQSIGR